VYWRKASEPDVHSRDGKGWRGGRLRLFNAGADSFNKLLSSDTAVSPGSRRQHRYKARGARILREALRRRTFRSKPKSGWDGVSRIGLARARFAAGPP